MSAEMHGSQEILAGAIPAERSGAGIAPANAAGGPATPPAADTPVSPAPPEVPVTAMAGNQPIIDPPAGNGTANVQGDEVPALPIDPRPFGAASARLCGRGPQPARRLISPQEAAASNRKLTAEQKLLILDTWQRSGLAANDFAVLVGVNRITLYAWKKKFEQLGPAGLMDPPRKTAGNGKVPDLTQRTILMVKKANPQWGCQRISDVLYRGPGLPASANTVARVLREAGYVLEEQATSPHPDKVRSFERASLRQFRHGGRICSRSCSSGRTAGSTWWRSWTITPASWSATPCTPPAPRRW